MTTSEEEKEEAIQRDLDEAVERYFKASGWEGFISGWVLIAHQHLLDETTGKVTKSGHPLVYMGGTMEDHVSLGLLQVAKDVIRGVGRWARDDDD